MSDTDCPIALAEWPNVSATYTYEGAPGAPRLRIALALNTAAYAPSAGTPAPAAATDATIFNSVCFQLNQNGNGLNTPGLSGPAVSLSLVNSLTGDTAEALPPALAEQLVTFANDCAATVNAAADGVAPPATLATTLTLSIDLASLPAGNVVRLRLLLVQSRLPCSVDRQSPDVPGGPTVRTEIHPATTNSDRSKDALLAFATALETCFAISAWQYRVGLGPSDPYGTLGHQTYTVWAVRFSLNNAAQGMSFNLGAAPVFYAPEPVANRLYTGAMKLPVYTTGSGLIPATGGATTFAGVDLNLWSARALAWIDAFLSPAYAVPAFLVDALPKLAPDDTGTLFGILRRKSQLAATIAGTIQPILLGTTPSTGMFDAAQEALKQALSRNLADAHEAASVAVVPVTRATTNEPGTPGTTSPPVLHGQPIDTGQPAGATPNHALSPASIALNAGGAASDDSTLAFLFTCAKSDSRPSIPLTLRYRLTHLRNNISVGPGNDRDRQSRWIDFVTGPFSFDAGSSPIEFPVPMRFLPLPPALLTQTATPARQTDPTPAQLRNWDYTFTYTASHAAQDCLLATVTFNDMVTAPPRPPARDPAAGLFSALAAMISCGPAIFNDFETYLRPLTPEAEQTGTAFINAKAAVTAWASLIADFARAYATWAAKRPLAKSACAPVCLPPAEVLTFQVELTRATNGDAVVEVVQAGGADQPIPAILIAPDTYQAEPYIPLVPRAGPMAAYRYVTAERSYLTYDEALAIPARTVSFSGLDGLRYQRVNTAIEIQRNLDLVRGQEVNDVFVFRTGPVAFAAPMVPMNVTGGYDLNRLNLAPPAPLSAYLSEFFGQLLGANGEDSVTARIAASARYRLNLDPDSPSIVVPIALMAQGAPMSTAIAKLAAMVSGWLDEHRASLSGAGATLDFEVILFGTVAGATLPLIDIKDVFIKVDKLSL